MESQDIRAVGKDVPGDDIARLTKDAGQIRIPPARRPLPPPWIHTCLTGFPDDQSSPFAFVWRELLRLL